MLSNDEAIASYLEHMQMRGLAQTTVIVNRDHLRRLARFLQCALLEATYDDLMVYARSLSELAIRTRYAELSRAHNFYRWAFATRHTSSVPTERIPRPKLPRSVPRPIAEERLTIAIASASADVRAYLTLAAGSGLRACEVARLTRNDLGELEDPPVLVVRGKGSKERVVPLRPDVFAALVAYGLPERGPIFRRRGGSPGPPTANTVALYCNRHLRALGIPDTFHSLRHRAVTNVYRASKDIRVAQAFAGHSSPQTTAGYAAYAPDDLVAAVLAMPPTGGVRAVEIVPAAMPASPPQATPRPARASRGTADRTFDLQQLRRAVESSPLPLRAAMWLYAEGIGGRELSTLEWRDINLDEKLIITVAGAYQLCDPTVGTLRSAIGLSTPLISGGRSGHHGSLIVGTPTGSDVFLMDYPGLSEPKRVPTWIISKHCTRTLRTFGASGRLCDLKALRGAIRPE